MNTCYHCHEPIARGEDRRLEIDGAPAWFCCAGCEAVTRLIHDAGLDDFYRFRSAPSPTADAHDDGRWQGFNEPAVLDVYAPARDGVRELRLQLDDLRCAACGWLVEKTVGERQGVQAIRLNAITGRAMLRWKQDEVSLADLLAVLGQLGFKPHPLRADEDAGLRDNERRTFLKRLAVAGLGMMQVMMYGLAMYIGAFDAMDAAIREFLRYVSLLIATPVVVYSAAPFFRGAWRDLFSRRAGMDVPIALAIGGAYLASLWHTFEGTGEVYFDSVSMFVFFLLIGRFAEAGARHEVAAVGNALVATLPAVVQRVDADGNATSIPLTLIRKRDVVRVANGETTPADGTLLDDLAHLDEALLTGESTTVTRRADETLRAGSINRGVPFLMQVTHVGRDTLISGIARLLENAQSSRPRLGRLSDRLARWFVAGVLVAAAVTAYAWWQLDAARAFEITLSVLVVTCPCALALAVPVALTTATATLARSGLLTVHSDALETLAAITDVVFDKTGTLTLGEPRIARTVIAGALSETACVALATGLEIHTSHPIAKAFRESGFAGRSFERVEQHVGRGVCGMHMGCAYRLGTPAFALADPEAPIAPAGMSGSWILLADDDGPLAWFELEDTLRPEAGAALAALRTRGLRIHLFSGDSDSTVHALASSLGIEHSRARQSPQDKLACLLALQAEGRRVLMIGDGINDAPVLAGADVSMAMSDGASLAHASAGFILTGSLAKLPALLAMAHAARRIMRQNLAWALGYNAFALPLAAAGMVAPWMAAIGMSASSLLVTLNAMRLSRSRAREPQQRAYSAPAHVQR